MLLQVFYLTDTYNSSTATLTDYVYMPYNYVQMFKDLHNELYIVHKIII